MKKEKLLQLLQTSAAVRKAQAENNIDWFARYYLHNHVRSTVGTLHQEWSEIMTTKKRAALAAPRGHAKSTWWSLVYVLYSILFNKKKFIILVSDTAGQAEELLGSVIEELETNERIIKDFGKIAGYVPPKAEEKKKWTVKDIVTLTGTKVIAVGWKAKLRGLKYGGRRPDLIILDDVENDENVENPDQRDKVKRVFRKSILNLGDRDTQIFVIGTILHFDSLLMDILNNPPPGWFTKLYRAIQGNEALWPEWWTLETLAEKKAEIGSIAFEQEYMNNPLDPETQILKPAAFFTSIDLTMCECYAYIDLAISEKETADYFAIVTIARERQTGFLYVVEPVRIRGDITKQLNLVFEQYKKYNHVTIGVESVAYQKVFAQILRNESNQQRLYIPVVEVEIDKDKVRRAVEIVPFIENGTVKFNNNYQDFMAEIIQFPKAAHDDFVDAFVGAVKLATNKKADLAVTSPGTGLQYPKNY